MGQRQPVTARVYDYWLGGTHNFPEDQAHAKRLLEVFPEIEPICKANRAFLRRAVRVAAQAGIEQFLDLGSGLPTEGNVHEIARAVNPTARVVYVDIDPVAAQVGRAMISGMDGLEYLCADLRDTDAVLGSEEVNRCLDLRKPVAVLMIAMLPFVQEKAAEVVAAFRDVSAPGSYLVISHATNEFQPEQMRQVAQVYEGATLSVTMRSRAEIAALFDGYRLLEPGLVTLTTWRPQPGDFDPFEDPTHSHTLVAVGQR